MRTLHRHLLRELLWNAVTFLAVILAIAFVMSLAFKLGSSRVQGVPFWVVFRSIGYFVVANLHLVIPLTVLAAAIFTYGRSSADGEFTAMRVAGIHPYQAIVPALLLGSGATMGLAWLQDEIMPAAHYHGRIQLRGEILENLGELLQGPRRKHSESRWEAIWREAAEDEQGRLNLLDLYVSDKDSEGNVVGRTIAERALPVYDRRTNRLRLRLWGVKRYSGERLLGSSAYWEMDLDLDHFAHGSLSTKRERDRTYEELLTRSRHMEAEAAVAPEGSPEARRSRRRARENLSDYHFRMAFAFSGVLFAFLGAALGLFKAVGNRALVFLVGFLIVMGVYFPLQELGLGMAERGTLPAPVALWLGNTCLLLIAGSLFWKVTRG